MHNVVKGSQKPIPYWLPVYIAGHKRIWGRVIINYPIDHIKPAYESGNNPRLNPFNGLDIIKDKLKKMGFMGTLPVTPLYINEETNMVVYGLIDGDRRYLSWKSLGGTTLDIVVYEGSEREIAPFRMSFNASSEVPDVDQAIYIYNTLIQRYGYTHQEISQICSQNSKSVGRSWVTLMANIAQNCIKEVLDAWRDGKIKKTHAMHISQLYCIADKEQQLQLLNYIITNKMKASDLKGRIEKKKSQFVLLPEKQSKHNKSFPLKPKRNDKRKRNHARSTFELTKRYESLKKKSHDNTDNKTTQALLKEYKWILSMSDKPCP
jgi:hypothetical protein